MHTEGITMGEKVFRVYRKYVEGPSVKAYVLDELHNPYLLLWPVGQEPGNRNIAVVVLKNPFY